MDRMNNFSLLSLFNFSEKIDEKINLKKTVVVGIDPEVKLFENFLNPTETILNIIIKNPKNCVIGGVEMDKYLVHQHLKLKENETNSVSIK